MLVPIVMIKKNSYDSQVRHYREYISQHQDWILVDIYADEGISGTQVGKRQDFQRLISDCLDGKNRLYHYQSHCSLC